MLPLVRLPSPRALTLRLAFLFCVTPFGFLVLRSVDAGLPDSTPVAPSRRWLPEAGLRGQGRRARGRAGRRNHPGAQHKEEGGAPVTWPSKAFALTWYRALTWYFLGLSSPRTHFEPWKTVGTRGRAPLAAR